MECSEAPSLRSQTVGDIILALPLTTCVTLGELPTLSVSACTSVTWEVMGLILHGWHEH